MSQLKPRRAQIGGVVKKDGKFHFVGNTIFAITCWLLLKSQKKGDDHRF